VPTHLGTRGCLFDFSARLADYRQKVLSGFICKSCQAIMVENGHEKLIEDLTPLLGRRWLGDPADPSSPAGISAKLGHDLFMTKGLKPKLIESIKMGLIQEGTKQVLQIIAAVLLAAFLLWLGISSATGKGGSPHGSPSPTAGPTK
jgi:hypothetical protein